MSINCKRCGKPLFSKESIRRQYGPTCYKIVSFQNKNKWRLALRKGLNTLKYRKKKEIIIQKIVPESTHLDTINISLQNITDRLRKVELDNSYLKARENHIGVISSKPVEDPIERIKREESAKLTDPTLREFREVFQEVVSELKEVLKIRREKIEKEELDVNQLKLSEVRN